MHSLKSGKECSKDYYHKGGTMVMLQKTKKKKSDPEGFIPNMHIQFRFENLVFKLCFLFVKIEL